MMKYIAAIIFLFFTFSSIVAQTCEKYNRKLFHSLPENFPDSINCKDKLGKKQGWWIYYEVQFNPVDQPDRLEKGDYVQDYLYGQYKEDRKIGTWKTVYNVHSISNIREDRYYYTKDTSRIMSEFGGSGESEIIYTQDSSIINSISKCSREKNPICIACNKKTNTCIMTYRKKIIKKFPFKDFEIEFEKTFFMYEHEKKIIDYNQK